MAQVVSFQEPMEQLVRFVEDTAPDHMVAAAQERLNAGVQPRDLLAAAGLAVSRSTELPPSHHGGPVHPVCGLSALNGLTERLSGKRGFLPTIQGLALANRHIHAPEMGPAAMAVVDVDDLVKLGKKTVLDGFRDALHARVAPTAIRHMIALTKMATPGEIMEGLLSVALPRNALDDHYFLYVVYAFRALDDLGWEHAGVMLRPPVQFLTRHPMMEHGDGMRGQIIADGIALYRAFTDLESALDQSGLVDSPPPFDTNAGESRAIDLLADEIALIEAIPNVSTLLIDAMVGGLSIMGTLEAMSIGGGRRYLRSDSGNPFDVHIHTGVNARRYLLGLPDLSLRTKLLALLSWGQGYEVRHLDRTMRHPVGADPHQLARLPRRDQTTLLDAIAEDLASLPVVDLTALTGSIADLVAPQALAHTIALAQQYAQAGHDPDPFFALMADLVCHDDQSEMHAYKMQQAAYEEYQATRDPFRWVHIVSAARHLAVIMQMRPRTVYPQALKLLPA